MCNSDCCNFVMIHITFLACSLIVVCICICELQSIPLVVQISPSLQSRNSVCSCTCVVHYIPVVVHFNPHLQLYSSARTCSYAVQPTPVVVQISPCLFMQHNSYVHLYNSVRSFSCTVQSLTCSLQVSSRWSVVAWLSTTVRTAIILYFSPSFICVFQSIYVVCSSVHTPFGSFCTAASLLEVRLSIFRPVQSHARLLLHVSPNSEVPFRASARLLQQQHV